MGTGSKEPSGCTRAFVAPALRGCYLVLMDASLGEQQQQRTNDVSWSSVTNRSLWSRNLEVGKSFPAKHLRPFAEMTTKCQRLHLFGLPSTQ